MRIWSMHSQVKPKTTATNLPSQHVTGPPLSLCCKLKSQLRLRLLCLTLGQVRAVLGIEPRTSRTRSENHTTRQRRLRVLLSVRSLVACASWSVSACHFCSALSITRADLRDQSHADWPLNVLGQLELPKALLWQCSLPAMSKEETVKLGVIQCASATASHGAARRPLS